MTIRLRSLALLGSITLTLGNLGRLPLGSVGGRSAPFVLNDLSTALVAAVLAGLVLTRRVRPSLDRISLPAAVFALIAVTSAGLGIMRYHMGFADALGTLAYFVRWVLYFCWYLFVAWCLTAQEARESWRYVENALLVFAVFGIVQSAFLPGFAQMVQGGSAYPTWDVQGWRLVSTLLDPNLAGLLLVFAVLFRLARISTGAGHRAGGWPLVLLTVALLLTLSRSSVLALVAGLVAILILGGLSFRVGYAFLAGGLVAVPLLWLVAGYAASLGRFSVNASALSRIEPWLRGFRLIAQHPVMGVGFDALKQAQLANGWTLLGDSHATIDGGLLLVAVLTGTVGLAVFLWMIRNVWRLAGETARDTAISPEDRAHAMATAASTVAMIVHSLFVNSLLLSFVMQIVWIMWATLSHIAASPRAARRALGIGVVAPLLIVATGCQPCANTDVCAPVMRVDLIGQIVDARSGVPVSGATVDVSLNSGEQFGATSDRNGNWEAAHSVQAPLPVEASITVTAPGRMGYTISPFKVIPSTRRGEATLVGAWTSHPHVHYLATLARDGKLLVGARVKFTPTGGVPVTGTFTGVTDVNGTFQLMLDAQALGTVVGTLTITDAQSRPIAQLAGFSIPLEYRQQIAAPAARYDVGTNPHWAWVFELWWNAGMVRAQGVKVAFHRTGGLAISPDSIVGVTRADGRVTIQASVTDTGVVQGELLIMPAAGPVRKITGLQLSSYRGDVVPLAGVYGFGPSLRHFATLKDQAGDPIAGATVTWIQDSGMAAAPSRLTMSTDSTGRFRILIFPPDNIDGSVTGHLVVVPPAPYASGSTFTIANITLATYLSPIERDAGVFVIPNP